MTSLRTVPLLVSVVIVALAGGYWLFAPRPSAPAAITVPTQAPKVAVVPPPPAEPIESAPPRESTLVPALAASAQIAEANALAELPRGSSAALRLTAPLAHLKAADIQDTFDQSRDGGTRRHEATDILAPRGTPILAVNDGQVAKLFLSKPGGISIYQFDPTRAYCYYYAHLDHYAEALHEGKLLKRGEVIGYVGTTGDAPADTPHLHFALLRLGPEKQWWKSTPENPYALLRAAVEAGK